MRTRSCSPIRKPPSARRRSLTSPMPLLVALPRLIRAKYLTAANRWTALFYPGQVALLSAPATDGDPLRAPLLSEHGVADVVSLVFRDRFGCWGFLDLWRAGGVFTAAAMPRRVAASPRRARRRGLARGPGGHLRPPRPPPRPRRGPDPRRDAPLARARRDRPDSANPRVPAKPSFRPSGGRAPVPASAYNVAAQLLAVESGVDDHQAERPGPPLRRAVAHLACRPHPPPGSDPSPSPSRNRHPLSGSTLFARACALSTRESELLTHLGSGADTREVAGRMFLSRAHRAGPPQVGVRQDRHEHQGPAAGAGPRYLTR